MAISEIETAKYYDYKIINDDFTEAVRQIAEIIDKERAKR